ncbi:hypothetical protein GF324_10565, partial [bacterium]|nr:hypothetical protein [bacterium]
MIDPGDRMKRLPLVLLVLLFSCISTPAQELIEEGHYLSLHGRVDRMVLKEDHLYMFGFNNGLRVYDVSDADHWVETEVIPTPVLSFPRVIWQMEVHDDLLILTPCAEELWIMDVSDPAHPERLSIIHLTMDYVSFAVVGDFLFLAGYGFDSVHVYSIADASNPVRLEDLDQFQAHNPQPVHASDSLMAVNWEFWARQERITVVYDMSNPAEPDSIASWISNLTIERFQWIGQTLWAMTDHSSTHSPAYVVDFTDWDSPEVAGEFDITTCDLVNLDTLVFGFHRLGLRAFSLADPSNPYRLDLTGDIHGRHRCGTGFEGDLITSVEDEVLSRKDLSALPSVTTVEELFRGHRYSAICLQDDYLFAASHIQDEGADPGGIATVLDLRFPANPVVAYHNPQVADVREMYHPIASYGNQLLIRPTPGTMVYDIQEPENPMFQGEWDRELNGGIVVIGDRAVGGHHPSYHHHYVFTLWDLSSPTSPVLLDSLQVGIGTGEGGESFSFTANSDAVYFS